MRILLGKAGTTAYQLLKYGAKGITMDALRLLLPSPLKGYDPPVGARRKTRGPESLNRKLSKILAGAITTIIIC
jgi:hypothetical protein